MAPQFAAVAMSKAYLYPLCRMFQSRRVRGLKPDLIGLDLTQVKQLPIYLEKEKKHVHHSVLE